MKALSVIFIVTFVAIFSSLVAFGADPTLVLLMPFEEGSGTVAKDLSGRGNDGTLMGGAKWIDGKYGKALQFNGTDSYVNIKSNASLQAEDSGFTIEAWINADPASIEWARVVDKFYGTGYNVGRPGAGLGIGAEWAGSANTFTSTTAVFNNQWHHIALARIVKDVEGVKLNLLKIYVDGKMESTITGGSTMQHNMDSTSVKIGAGIPCCVEGGDVGIFFKGVIDEVAIYRKMLTDDEVKKDMAGIAHAVEYLDKLATTWASIKK